MNSSIQSLSEDGYEGVTIRLPHGTEQKLYTPQDNACLLYTSRCL